MHFSSESSSRARAGPRRRRLDDRRESSRQSRAPARPPRCLHPPGNSPVALLAAARAALVRHLRPDDLAAVQVVDRVDGAQGALGHGVAVQPPNDSSIFLPPPSVSAARSARPLLLPASITVRPRAILASVVATPHGEVEGLHEGLLLLHNAGRGEQGERDELVEVERACRRSRHHLLLLLLFLLRALLLDRGRQYQRKLPPAAMAVLPTLMTTPTKVLFQVLQLMVPLHPCPCARTSARARSPARWSRARCPP